ncbi:peptidoglycan-binding protein, partial [Microbacterium sp.]|uniref:peptidoglycan-binding protein n=1 Tax=Microbacterium sp. TaxID=51671 RepID=UPI003A8379BD
ELAPLVGELLKRTKQMGYSMDAAYTSGYDCSYTSGTKTLSSHAYGRAIDINGHVNLHSKTFKSTLPPAVVKMWLNAGFSWGGHHKKYDTMHFEYVGSKRAISGYYDKLMKTAVSTAPPVKESGSFPQLHKGSHNKAAVKTLQYLLRGHGYSLATDGSFGHSTHEAVLSFQSKCSLHADGVVGHKTWPELLPKLRHGSKGEAVKALQLELRAAGHHVLVTGYFGLSTKLAVFSHQRSHGLHGDGVVDSHTWGSLVD